MDASIRSASSYVISCDQPIGRQLPGQCLQPVIRGRPFSGTVGLGATVAGADWPAPVGVPSSTSSTRVVQATMNAVTRNRMTKGKKKRRLRNKTVRLQESGGFGCIGLNRWTL